MALRIGKKTFVSICLILLICVVFGGLIHTISSQNHNFDKMALAADDDAANEELENSDKSDKDKNNDKNEKKNGNENEQKDKKTKKSYASYLFDKTDKNQSIMYFNSQTSADVPTVQSTINEKADAKNGEQYAAFLNTLGKWNLYNTYTSQLDAGIGIIGKAIRFIAGVVILGCLYLMNGIDGLLQITAKLVDYLNVFKYLVDGQGNIPKSNPMHVLQPIVDLYKQFTVFAKIIVAISLAILLFRIATLGTRRPKGYYLGRGLSKFVLACITIALVPLMLSAFFGVFADMIKSDKGYANSNIEDVPSRYIVDTRAYIDNSLTSLKDKKNNDAVNGGYVLLHEHKDMPKTKKDVENKIPTAGLVKYLNTGDSDSKKNPDGKNLIWKWMTGDTFTGDDVDSMYSLSKDDKSHAWAFWENDEKRSFQFKLAYGPESVKTFDGKDPFSLDLNGVSIQSASLAGNGPMGVVLNGMKMSTVILGTTFVCVTLILSIFAALIKSFGLIGSNLGLAAFGSPQGAFGLVSVLIMLMVSWISALLILPIYSEITEQIDTLMTEGINDQFDMGGLAKQTISTLGLIFVQWFCAIFALKGRGALMNGIEDFFKSVIDRVSSYSGTRSSNGINKGAEALRQMNNADKSGYQNNLDRMTAPIGKAKEAAGNIPLSAMKYGSDKLGGAAESIKEKGKEIGKNGVEKAKNSVSNLKNRMTSDEEVNDKESQGNDVQNLFKQGLDAMGRTGVSDMKKNIDNQENATDKALQNQTELDDAKQGLEDAQKHYNDLEESGASNSELLKAQDDVDKAQDRYNNALANSQSSAREMAGTGATAGSIADAKKSTADDFQKANRDATKAKNDLETLKEEREEMEKEGATPEALASIDEDIRNAEDRLVSAQDRQRLAKSGYDANVGNAQTEKDGRNDVIAARQAERQAQREVETAKTTGNLNPQEQNSVRKTTGAMTDSIKSLKDSTQKDLTKAEATRGALQYMANNHNQAFTDTDKQNYASFVDSTADSVQNVKSQLAEVKKNKGSKSQVAALSQRVMDANKLQASAQTVMGAIDSGSVSDQAITAQQQIIQAISEEKTQAQQAMENLNEAAGNGQTISRASYNRIQSNLDNANHKAQIADKTLSSLHAMKATGTNTLNGSQMDQALQSANKEINNIKTRHSTLKEASNALNHVNTGGQITRKNLLDIVNGQKIAQQASGSITEEKRAEFNSIGNKLASLKKQLSNGKPVSHEVQRMQNNYDQIEKQLINAENQEKAVRSSGQTLKGAGRSMIYNLKTAQNNLLEKQNLKQTREKEYENILQTGGYTSDQLASLKKDIDSERLNLNSNGSNHSRDRKQKLSNIKTKVDRANSIMEDN